MTARRSSTNSGSRAPRSARGFASLRGAAARAVFASPLRLELVDTLQRLRGASIRELARATGRPADALYFHVRKLLRAGAVVEQGRRATGRRPEAVFAVAAAGLRVDPEDRSSAARVARHAAARSVLRMAGRHYEAAVASGVVRQEGARRNVCFARTKAHLDPAALAGLHRRVDDLVAFLRRCEAQSSKSSTRSRGEPCVLTLVLSPLVPAAGRRSPP